MENNEALIQHLMAIGRHAREKGIAGMTIGEQLCAALALNRFDWLRQLDTTMAEAIDLIGPTWLAQLPGAALALHHEAPP